MLERLRIAIAESSG